MTEPATVCPACRNQMLSMVPFYRVGAIPVQSVRLVAEQRQARMFSRGSLMLRRCNRCGFVFNEAYEPGSQYWDAEYEETQACSGHFNQFARDLVEHLVSRYSLNGKRIMEVGCGKGDFIAALCANGRNVGLGIDPAFDPSRNPDASNAVDYEVGVLEDRHFDFRPDLIICRHTLEHIDDVHGFLSRFRLGGNADLCIEVPDWERIADEGAFWDVYYEHCSYFDAHSLTTALAIAGLTVHETERMFGDQYLLAYANCQATHDYTLWARSSIGQLPRALASWRRTLTEWNEQDKRVVLWGGGSKAVAFVSSVGPAANSILAAVDINPRKQGHYLPGSAHPVCAPEELAEKRPDYVVVMNPEYRQEIAQSLEQLGITAQLIGVNDPIDGERARAS